MNTVLVLSLKSKGVEANFFCTEIFFPQIWPRRRAGRGNLVRDGYQDQALLRPSIAKGGGAVSYT